MSYGAVLEKGIMKSTYTDRVVSRSLKEQMSLIISIYSNISASRLPATVGRRTDDATFLKGPVSNFVNWWQNLKILSPRELGCL